MSRFANLADKSKCLIRKFLMPSNRLRFCG